MKKMILLVLLGLIYLTPIVNSQIIPCMPNYTGFIQQFKEPSKYPDYRIDMPINVKTAYLLMDSVAKNASYSIVDSFVNSQIYSDTLKYLRKYFYELADYDPILFSSYRLHKDLGNLSLPSDFISDLEEKIHHIKIPNVKNDLAFFSDVIAHIKVLGTDKRINKNASIAKSQIRVCSELIERIKGKHLHSDYCLPLQNTSGEIKGTEENKYLSFTYCLEWQAIISLDAYIHDETIETKYKDGLAEISKEYIVFLKTAIYCVKDGISYFDYSPNGLYSPVYSIYPIVDGIVQDPGDDFGFGKGLKVEDFKNQLRKRIEMIKNIEG